MKSVYICLNHDCELRYLDATKISKYFKKNNFKIVKKPYDADIIFFIACAVVNEVSDDALNRIQSFKKYDAELIVAGCLPEMEKEKLSKIFDGRTLVTKEFDGIDELFPENKISFNEIKEGNNLFDFDHQNTIFTKLKESFSENFFIFKILERATVYVVKHILVEKSFLYHVLIDSKKKYFICISRGCMGNCSYCTIPKAVGRHKSKPFDQCLNEFKKGLEQGYKQFVITADDVSIYGLDIDSTLPKLLRSIVAIPDDFEISIRGIHPRFLIKYIDDLMDIFDKGKITRLGIPIQSGSSRVLKLMNRYSDTNKMSEALIKFKNNAPFVTVHTHYLMGFPTETFEDVTETLEYMVGIKFDAGFIYPFSCKTGSVAEKIEPKISQEEIKKRMYYAKKFLKKAGYKVIYLPKTRFFSFELKDQ